MKAKSIPAPLHRRFTPIISLIFLGPIFSKSLCDLFQLSHFAIPFICIAFMIPFLSWEMVSISRKTRQEKLAMQQRFDAEHAALLRQYSDLRR